MTDVTGKQLPTKGKIRYIPPENWDANQTLPKRNGGYIDKFDNIWIKEPSRTQGQPLNVSLDGKITHK